MKTTITMLALLLSVGTAQFASAKGFDKNDEITSVSPANKDVNVLNKVLNTYVNGISKGQVEGIGQIIEDKAEFSTISNGKVQRHDKAGELAQLSHSAGVVQQDCNTTYTILESKGGYALAKVVMTYQGFSRENFVNLAHDGQSWKITGVTSLFSKK